MHKFAYHVQAALGQVGSTKVIISRAAQGNWVPASLVALCLVSTVLPAQETAELTFVGHPCAPPRAGGWALQSASGEAKKGVCHPAPSWDMPPPEVSLLHLS